MKRRLILALLLLSGHSLAGVTMILRESGPQLNATVIFMQLKAPVKVRFYWTTPSVSGTTVFSSSVYPALADVPLVVTPDSKGRAVLMNARLIEILPFRARGRWKLRVVTEDGEYLAKGDYDVE